MQKIISRIEYFERVLSKTIKQLTFFLSGQVPLSGQDYKK